ncbi:hypothetical protein RI543_002060 [Arxiozyma heterogenica]|uniref:Uncharacterized protein n=1 Tax=Arxiozyma heterogenica TaxID=278026 RepID=A0AAN7WHZ2_9SACH|nr:hypothetical protein RI543_002060 [Kazachstania heterogenica]
MGTDSSIESPTSFTTNPDIPTENLSPSNTAALPSFEYSSDDPENNSVQETNQPIDSVLNDDSG